MSSTKPGSPEFLGQGSPEIDTTVSEESRRKFGGFTLEQGKVRWESETAGIRPTVRELVHSRRCLVTCSIWRQDSSTTVDSGTIAEQKGPRQGQQQAQIGGTLEFKRYRWYLLRDPTRTRKESRRFTSGRAHCSIENWASYSMHSWQILWASRGCCQYVPGPTSQASATRYPHCCTLHTVCSRIVGHAGFLVGEGVTRAPSNGLAVSLENQTWTTGSSSQMTYIIELY